MSSSPPIVKAPIDQTTLNAQKTICRGRYRVIGEDLEVMATVLIDPTTGEAMTISTQNLNKPDWVLGKLIEISIDATAGNVQTVITPPVGKRYRFVRAHLHLITDATVINRVMELRGKTGVNFNGLYASVSAVTANSATDRYWMAGETYIVDTVTTVFPKDVGMMENTSTYIFIVGSGQAGDSYTGLVTFLEETI